MAELERPRAVRGLQRDYAVVYTGYIYGLRAGELAGLTPDDWSRCAEVTKMGRFGQLLVRDGKGANGSGKRARIVPTTHAGFPEFIEWYLSEVRPLYKANARSDESLFFNERGGRLSVSSIEKWVPVNAMRVALGKASRVVGGLLEQPEVLGVCVSHITNTPFLAALERWGWHRLATFLPELPSLYTVKDEEYKTALRQAAAKTFDERMYSAEELDQMLGYSAIRRSVLRSFRFAS